jgi:hypothetical protein
VHQFHAAAVDLQVVGDLPVRVRVGDPGGAREVAQERYERHRRRQVGTQSRHRQRQTAALAAAEHRNPGRVDLRQGTGRVHRTYRVGVEPAVVVALRIGDSPGHHAGHLRTGRRRVGGVADAPAGALAAGVHLQVGEAGRGPEQILQGVPASAAVADVLHHGGQRTGLPGRHPQPGADVLTGVAAERHVVRRDSGQPGDHLGQPYVEVVSGGLSQRPGPEVVEVRRRGL